MLRIKFTDLQREEVFYLRGTYDDWIKCRKLDLSQYETIPDHQVASCSPYRTVFVKPQ